MYKIWVSCTALVIACLAFPGRAIATDLDPTFGTAGKTTTSFGNNASVNSITLQADGRIVAVGYLSNGSNLDWQIGRYHANGSIDTTFGSGGFVTRNFGGDDALEGVALQSDGRIVVSGYTRVSPGVPSDWTVARYHVDGTPDLGFGLLGVAQSFPGEIGRANDVMIQPDGKIVAVGGSWKPSTHDEIAAARYHSDGSPDTSFGSGGIVAVGLNIGGTPNERAYGMDLQPDGKILAFGDYDTGQHRDDAVLVRFNSNGSLDSSFDGDGFRPENFSHHNGGRDVKVQPDGKIVVTGATCPGGPCDTFVARYNSDGSLDTGFDADGKVVTSFSSGTESGHEISLLPDGKIVLAGFLQSGNVQDGVVHRYNPDGGMDTSFGIGGSLVMALSPGDDNLNGLAVQPDGKILVAGASHNGSHHDWVLARITEQSLHQATIYSSADTYVRSGQDNRNTGASDFMRIRSDGNNRALVRFDQAELLAIVADGTVLEATLRLTIVNNGNNWGTTGRTIDIHRLLADWAEGNGTEADRGSGPGATWNCAVDSNIANQAKDCGASSEWEMGQPNNPEAHPWDPTPSGTQTIINDQSGIVEYDLTADLIAFLNGTSGNFGWILKKTDEGLPGAVSFGTNESPAAAQLVLTYQQ